MYTPARVIFTDFFFLADSLLPGVKLAQQQMLPPTVWPEVAEVGCPQTAGHVVLATQKWLFTAILDDDVNVIVDIVLGAGLQNVHGIWTNSFG